MEGRVTYGISKLHWRPAHPTPGTASPPTARARTRPPSSRVHRLPFPRIPSRPEIFPRLYFQHNKRSTTDGNGVFFLYGDSCDCLCSRYAESILSGDDSLAIEASSRIQAVSVGWRERRRREKIKACDQSVGAISYQIRARRVCRENNAAVLGRITTGGIVSAILYRGLSDMN